MSREFSGIVDLGSTNVRNAMGRLTRSLLNVPAENTGTWQSLIVEGSELHATHELVNVSIRSVVDPIRRPTELARYFLADVPWAEDHFQERVSGEPMNPGEEWKNWPYHTHQADLHRTAGQGKFDHNYMERYWPKQANKRAAEDGSVTGSWLGIRYPYGDLGDVVNLLRKHRGTRQAYLPVFFPEDTGSVQGQRVPCSLGYHFLVRDFTLYVQYSIRSCDIYRHVRNDLYLTARLGQWVAKQAELDVDEIVMTTNIASLHLFVGDVHRHTELMSSHGAY